MWRTGCRVGSNLAWTLKSCDVDAARRLSVNTPVNKAKSRAITINADIVRKSRQTNVPHVCHGSIGRSYGYAAAKFYWRFGWWTRG